MTDTEDNPELRGEREGKGVYVLRNGRGGEVRVGVAGTPDSFTPGELLQMAVATCAALSADHVLGSRLGHDFEAALPSLRWEDIPRTRLEATRHYTEIGLGASKGGFLPYRVEELYVGLENAFLADQRR